jgi:hypothetical protein
MSGGEEDMKPLFVRGMIAVLWLTLWPVMASAEPAQPKGKLVYSDNFSDPSKSGLEDNVNATDYSRGFHAPGVYHLRLLQANDTRWSIFPNQTYGSFTLELDIWDNSDDFVGDMSQGVVIRATDPNHFYAVLIDPRNGQYAVRKLDGESKWSDLIAWKPSPLIKQKAQVNHLRVDADGDTLTMYLNAQTLDTVKDAAYARGGFGLIGSNVDATKPHLHFDNVMVYSTEANTGASTGANGSSLPGAGQADLADPAALVVLSLALLALGVWCRARGQGSGVGG